MNESEQHETAAQEYRKIRRKVLAPEPQAPVKKSLVVAPKQMRVAPPPGEKHPSHYFFTSRIPFDPARIHAAAVYCSDGRLGTQIDDLLHNALQLPRYDRLAIPGGAACLAGHLAAYFEQECVLKQLRFLAGTHNLRRVVLVAHQGCAYYGERLKTPPEKLEEQQRKDLNKAIQRVRAFDENLQVDAFFAHLGETSVDFEEVKF